MILSWMVIIVNFLFLGVVIGNEKTNIGAIIIASILWFPSIILAILTIRGGI